MDPTVRSPLSLCRLASAPAVRRRKLLAGRDFQRDVQYLRGPASRAPPAHIHSYLVSPPTVPEKTKQP